MKKEDFLFVFIAPLLIFLLVFSLNLKINYLTSLLLVFGIPILYMALKSKKKLKKISIFTSIIFVPLAVIIEILCISNNSWFVPKSVFPFRIIGIPIEDFVWMFFVTAIILLFYENFIKKSSKPSYNSKGLKLMAWIFYPIMFILIITYLVNPQVLKIPYSFFITGLIFIFIPSLLFLLKYPDYFNNFFKTNLYSFYIFIIFELIGVSLNHWVFNGTEYVGFVNVLGILFPVEEFIFVIVLGGFSALSYYEFFTKECCNR